MNLAFFSKIFSRCAQSSSSFAKTFVYVREACKYIDKGNYVFMYNISVASNGFKYIMENEAFAPLEQNLHFP